MERPGFGVAATLELTGITYRNLDYWARTGLVRSSIKQAAGRGTRRVYAFEDLVALRVVGRLREAGVPLQAIRKAVLYLKQRAERPLTTLALIAHGRRILSLTEDPKKMVEATAGGQVVIAIDVSPIRRHLEEHVVALRAPRHATVRVRGRAYRVVLTPDLEQGGYAAEVPELPGCYSEGDDVVGARRMAREAIELWLDATSTRTRDAGVRASGAQK
jgi:DNA-binding transcriptional MerR regulator/predicted RNase H-like HicB family nuclease